MALADQGLAGASGSFPHLDVLENAFGGRALGRVPVASGASANEATAGIGTSAYEQGGAVALGEGADLHTIAHEATHLFQQSSGMSESGSANERQADAVADRVVAGGSAADLLEGLPMSPTGAAGLSLAGGSPSPPVPAKPTNDAEYKALGGYTAFETNVTSFGLSKELALSSWKKAMDQLYTNTDEFERIKNDDAAVLAWVDSNPARAGYKEMADALLAAKPLDTDKTYALWSGKPSHTYAESQGCTVLEGTHLGKLFDNVSIVFDEWSVTKTLWRAISDVYARQIELIMRNKKIHVYQRKLGEIFDEVESKAIQEIADDTGIQPIYEFHPLLTPGCFGGEWDYEKPYANHVWREDLKAAAGGDEARAKEAAEAEGVRIFDYSTTVPEASLEDQGACDRGTAETKINENNAKILGGCERAKTSLQASPGPT